MAAGLFRKLSLITIATGALILSGCGDPVLNLSGSEQENAVKLAEFLKHYPEPDRVMIMGWLAADTASGLEMINGKKASEVLKIVNEEWKKLYAAEVVGDREIYRWADSEKVPVFGMKELQDLCDNGILQVQQTSDSGDRNKAWAERAKRVYRNFHVACRLSGTRKDEVLVTLGNQSEMPFSRGAVRAAEAFVEFSVPGGISPGQMTELTFRNAALARSIAGNNECVPVYMEFLDQENHKNFHLDYYAPGNAVTPGELDDYDEFRKAALEEINGSYNRAEAVRELCDMSRNVRVRTGDAVKSYISAYPAEQGEKSK